MSDTDSPFKANMYHDNAPDQGSGSFDCVKSTSVASTQQPEEDQVRPREKRAAEASAWPVGPSPILIMQANSLTLRHVSARDQELAVLTSPFGPWCVQDSEPNDPSATPGP
ncbi:hypothetical protein CDD80_2145 [Ophiocordyceps camponoti-rufipedis]|uniref:Uncharacterized protein n=1 Tax=Ophiocordyceps camponoti-rufipedis TaxID=2004952 RepID=A0A2C5Z8J7_9HYPO|nr:hypothetical protein CDD80_2145 [Ophiocordyceps camponoti-rufipedis]